LTTTDGKLNDLAIFWEILKPSYLKIKMHLLNSRIFKEFKINLPKSHDISGFSRKNFFSRIFKVFQGAWEPCLYLVSTGSTGTVPLACKVLRKDHVPPN
jgi:hypothetical protein